MVLDDRAHEPVQRCVGRDEILELVEADDGQTAVGLVQHARKVEQLDEDLARTLRLARGRPAGDADRQPGYAELEAHPRQQPVEDPPWVAGQIGERAGDARGDVAGRRHLAEVDEQRAMPDLPHRRNVRREHARLAVAAGGGEPDRDGAGGRALEGVELVAAIDEDGALDRPLIVERVHSCMQKAYMNVTDGDSYTYGVQGVNIGA